MHTGSMAVTQSCVSLLLKQSCFFLASSRSLPLILGFTEFEQVEKAFRAALRPWIRRGILDGRALGWEKWDEGQVKLD